MYFETVIFMLCNLDLYLAQVGYYILIVACTWDVTFFDLKSANLCL